MTDLARLRSDLPAISRAIGQPLTDWQAESFTLDHRTSHGLPFAHGLP
jgi:hypothetical protein